MENLKKILAGIWVLLISSLLFLSPKAFSSSKAPSNNLNDRINTVREKVKDKITKGEVQELKSFNIGDETLSEWNNWPNWGNWNNWAKWDNWNNWANWGNWGNWGNF